MFKPVSVKALNGFRIEVAYADGVEGIADLSHLAGKGIFAEWMKPGVFEKVHINPHNCAIAWSSEIELCPDALYLQLTGQSPESAFQKLETSSYARAV